ncbi:MAG: hypothetical protein PWQ79_1773 [Thermococcaceae archaeon]|nr:hypothetical protein [Thermococcaceae archaeon]MDK2914858.1 hypothetical protein [Thermococcaceae archaeon]
MVRKTFAKNKKQSLKHSQTEIRISLEVIDQYKSELVKISVY